MIARGGRKFVGAGALATAAALPFLEYLSLGLASLTIFLAVVFRDPKRKIGEGVVAPADGKVKEVDPERGYVSTYLALRNVHVTRAPLDGLVIKAEHDPGRHRPAFSKRTHENEQVRLSLQTRIGEVSMVQMTGAIARRIVPYVREGQPLEKGERLSLIRFGSRVDLYLPPSSVKIQVKKGQRLVAGETCIAEVCDDSVE